VVISNKTGRGTPRDPAVTSRMMARVRSKDSKAELALRRALHARGFRYRLHGKEVLGRPDIVNRSRRLAIFVDGDMWHGNEHHRRGLASLAELFSHSNAVVGREDRGEHATRSRGHHHTA
jgi:DNA mismatch endonuclease Vsr